MFSRICVNENALLRGEKVIKGIDHIGIAVKSIEGSLPFYEKVLGLSLLKVEEVEEQGVKVAFIQCGNVKIELLEPLFEDSAVGAFIKKRGEGLHHVALGVRTIEERINELKEKGVHMIDDVPRKGAGEASIAFLHPKSANGVLYELCEKTLEEEKKHG
ncbi:methylmalonyl-CoA/ethylmalonyl-CoA epimerase [Priestia megaterium]|nr:methylmalonyl-CoA/ethylmalonyl-CoA epimerase [Priestia megaterium]